jgi:hypothetical protein
MNKKFIYFYALLILFSACQEPMSGFTEHIYRNSSDHRIALIAYINDEGETDFILEQREVKVYDHGPSEGENNPPVDLPRYAWDDSVVTIFDDTLAIMYDRGRLDGNPMRIENYELVEGQKEPYIYLFEFTNEDYERALDRGRIIK